MWYNIVERTKTQDKTMNQTTRNLIATEIHNAVKNDATCKMYHTLSQKGKANLESNTAQKILSKYNIHRKSIAQDWEEIQNLNEEEQAEITEGATCQMNLLADIKHVWVESWKY